MCMANLKVYEAERGFFDFTLTYGERWSDVSLRGKPIPKTATSRVYFSVKNTVSDADPFIAFTDEDPLEIQWLDETNGKIRVKLRETTEGHVGNDKQYELRLKMADGSWMTAKAGMIDILPSVVGTPA